MISISLIIPGKNCSSTIGRALDSVFNQTINPNIIEVIYVDDSSTDKSLEIVRNLKSKTTLKFKIVSLPNSFGGPSKARNVGIENAIGNYLFFLDADDFLEKHCLKKLLDKSKGVSDYVVATHFQCRQNKLGEKFKIQNICGLEHWDEFYNENFLEEYFRKYSMFSRKFCLFEHCWGRLIKKSIVKEHKIKFDEKLNQLEDILFNSTVLKKATKISIEPTPLYNHVLYGSNERLSNKAGENINIIEDLNYVTLNLANLYQKYSLNKKDKITPHEFIGNLISSKLINYIVRLSTRSTTNAIFSENVKSIPSMLILV